MCRAWKFDLRIIQQLAFAPEERYVYRTTIGPIPALQRSAICIVKASRHNPSPSRATVSNLRHYSILLPICKYGLGQIKKKQKKPRSIHLRGFHTTIFCCFLFILTHVGARSPRPTAWETQPLQISFIFVGARGWLEIKRLLRGSKWNTTGIAKPSNALITASTRPYCHKGYHTAPPVLGSGSLLTAVPRWSGRCALKADWFLSSATYNTSKKENMKVCRFMKFLDVRMTQAIERPFTVNTFS